jgi:hypothetical protein
MKLKLKGRRFDTIEEIQAESQSAWHSDRKGLPGSVQKMKEKVGPVSTRTTSLNTTRPSTIFYRLLLNWTFLRRH